MRTRVLLLAPAVALMLALACTDGARLTEPFAPEAPAFIIADADRGFKAGFYWLPPMVKNPSPSGTFDAELSPEIRICGLDGDECGPDGELIIFTIDGSDSEGIRVEVDDAHYIVNWHLTEYDLTESAHWRISVFAGKEVLLGFADVELVSNGRELRNVDTNEYIGLVDGRSLPIKFRIETGIVATVTVEPAEATIFKGETAAFTATVRDLHGGTIGDAAVSWASSDVDVAEVDGTGLATGVAGGGATITAEIDHESASADLTVLMPVARVEVEPAEALLEPGETQQFAATLYDENDDVLTGREVAWESSDEEVATVDEDGLATAVADGLVSLAATAEGVTGEAALTVAAAREGLVFETASAGSAHTCGVTEDGAALCWGLGGSGQLGDGSDTSSELPVAVVAEGIVFASIAAGDGHTCALSIEGAVFCWGSNHLGQLGNGNTTSSSVPVPVSADGLAFAAITAGGSFTCGLTTEGAAYCWGIAGRLGDGLFESSSVPVPVAIEGVLFAAISAGDDHTCAVTDDGAAYCWGGNHEGQLGDGSRAIRLAPVLVRAGEAIFASVAAGHRSTCGVTTDGVALCWGDNLHGQVGDGTRISRLTPVPVAADGLLFESLSAGGVARFTCGVATDRAAYCWGRGGLLGDGTTDEHHTPVQVASDGLSFRSLSAGGSHACAVSTDAAAYCWGSNTSGQLGDGTSEFRLSPVPVVSP